jgi:hypoxanthine phosphoribosyltransferase
MPPSSLVKTQPSTYPALESVLVSEADIKKRLKKMGAEIMALYGDEEITVIAVINGAILFTADLLRQIDNPVRLDCKPQVLGNLTLDLANRHVLLIDDILDTGKTLSLIVAMIKKLQPASVRTCVLLDKRGRREVEFEADLVGFQIPDKFVVGYGLDFAERYRNLPCIGVLKPNLQNPPEWA